MQSFLLLSVELKSVNKSLFEEKSSRWNEVEEVILLAEFQSKIWIMQMAFELIELKSS